MTISLLVFDAIRYWEGIVWNEFNRSSPNNLNKAQPPEIWTLLTLKLHYLKLWAIRRLIPGWSHKPEFWNIFKNSWIRGRVETLKYLSDAGEKVQKWTRLISTRRWVILVARTRRIKRRKYSRLHLDVFACGQVRLYWLSSFSRSLIQKRKWLIFSEWYIYLFGFFKSCWEVWHFVGTFFGCFLERYVLGRNWDWSAIFAKHLARTHKILPFPRKIQRRRDWPIRGKYLKRLISIN